jgi:hypothetical protein
MGAPALDISVAVRDEGYDPTALTHVDGTMNIDTVNDIAGSGDALAAVLEVYTVG